MDCSDVGGGGPPPPATTNPTPNPTANPTRNPTPNPTPKPTPQPSTAPPTTPQPTVPSATPQPTPPPVAGPTVPVPPPSTGDATTVCAAYESLYRTTYAPDEPTDFVYAANVPDVSPGVNPDTCSPGHVAESPFLDDALRRFAFFRWLARLDQVPHSSSLQADAQQCALGMALNNNGGSPYYHPTSDPHSSWPSWVCMTNAAKAIAPGNLYSGQSLPDLAYEWQTTPAYIVDQMVYDSIYSSSNVGHRQGLLCPDLSFSAFGHVCLHETDVSNRYLCGGCQHTTTKYPDSGTAAFPAQGFLAWPPPGAVPTAVLPDSSVFRWSFAAYHDFFSAGYAVHINGIPLSSSKTSLASTLCPGRGTVAHSGGSPNLQWLMFEVPSSVYNVNMAISVRVLSGTGDWSYTVLPTTCGVEQTTPAPTLPPLVCGNGVREGSEECDGGACCTESCTFRSAGSTCRSAVSICDVPEQCTGSSGECPTDLFAPSSVVCRSATASQVCDESERCTGSSPTCPNDAVRPSGTVCRASGGVCDTAEVCDGVSKYCPFDVRSPSGTMCRASTGDCDAAEECDGFNPACPPDDFSPAGTTCRAAWSDCDLEETCPGEATTCPPDALAPAGLTCRPAEGPCDVAESCPGNTKTCPSDQWASGLVQCRASAGICDPAEMCTGLATSCPPDTLHGSETVCRFGSGGCDIPEVCSGSASCPPDQVEPAGTVCRPEAEGSQGCDVPEYCSGVGKSCPSDTRLAPGIPCDDGISCTSGDTCDGAGTCSGLVVCEGCTSNADCTGGGSCAVGSCNDGFCEYTPASASTICRASISACDEQENCDGVSLQCPPDNVVPANTVCRPASGGGCDVAEVCDGVSPTCPADEYKSALSVCNPSAGPCDPAEFCSGDSPTCPTDKRAEAGFVCRSATAPCDLPEVCDGSSVSCPSDQVRDAGFVCRPAAGSCDVAEVCLGLAGGYSAKLCPPDTFAPSSTVCRPLNSSRLCDMEDTCSGVGPLCPADQAKPLGTVCRAATGVCDAAEVCDGVSTTCPSNSFAPAGTVCRAAAGLCDVQEQCSGSSASCGPDVVVQAGTPCRPAAGGCDVAETCTGSSAQCPADQLKDSSTVCRGPAHQCDAVERCTGSSSSCPPDESLPAGSLCSDGDDCTLNDACLADGTCTGEPCECSVDVDCDDGNPCTTDVCVAGTCAYGFAPAGAVCRPATGPCDVADVCTGDGACGPDLLQEAGTVCRASAGVCDVAEVCTGSSKGCPDNALRPSSHVCRAASGGCDLAELCTGFDVACPADVLRPSGAVCRASAGVCDVAETCDGIGGSCPSDTLQSSGVVCRPSLGPCDLAEVCTGSSPTCPDNAFLLAGTQCRASAGPCDVAEVCTGSSAACPANVLLGAEVVCRAAEGACDLEERCSGAAASCPDDAVVPGGTVCRESGGVCDVAEACDGVSTACPAVDAKVPAGTVCRSSAGACDVAEACTGSDNDCPANQFLGASVQCRPAAGICDVGETCPGDGADCPANSFLPSGTVCRAASADPASCDAEEVCSGSSALCPPDAARPVGSSCNDGDDTCTPSQDTCRPDGTCRGTLIPACDCSADADCDDGEACTVDTCNVDGICENTVAPAGTECRASAGACDVAEVCDGVLSSCPSDFFRPSGIVCRPPVGPCDVAESCSGSTAACPPDVLRPSSFVCRGATGLCDVDERCDGVQASCPANAYATAGTVCRPANVDAVCDAAEVCSGASPSCPEDVGRPAGSACSLGDSCVVGEVCDGTALPGSSCGGGSFVCECEEDSDCFLASGVNEQCTSVTCSPDRLCLRTPVPIANLSNCDDGDPCTVDDTCDGAGGCVGVLNCVVLEDGVCSGRGTCCGSTCVNCTGGYTGGSCEIPPIDDGFDGVPTLPPTPPPDTPTGPEPEVDECPTDPYRTKPGPCGCLATDGDGDGVDDCVDYAQRLESPAWPVQFDVYEPNVLGQNRLIGKVVVPAQALVSGEDWPNGVSAVVIKTTVASDANDLPAGAAEGTSSIRNQAQSLLVHLAVEPVFVNESAMSEAEQQAVRDALSGKALEKGVQVCVAFRPGVASFDETCMARLSARGAECVVGAAGTTSLARASTSRGTLGCTVASTLGTFVLLPEDFDSNSPTIVRLGEELFEFGKTTGLPLALLIAIGVCGWCCGLSATCFGAWLTRLAFKEQKERSRYRHNKAMDDRMRAAEERRAAFAAQVDGPRAVRRGMSTMDGLRSIVAPTYASRLEREEMRSKSAAQGLRAVGVATLTDSGEFEVDEATARRVTIAGGTQRGGETLTLRPSMTTAQRDISFMASKSAWKLRGMPPPVEEESDDRKGRRESSMIRYMPTNPLAFDDYREATFATLGTGKDRKSVLVGRGSEKHRVERLTLAERRERAADRTMEAGRRNDPNEELSYLRELADRQRKKDSGRVVPPAEPPTLQKPFVPLVTDTTRCAACNKLVLEAEEHHGLRSGAIFHDACFVCSRCGQGELEDYVEIDGKAVCDSCSSATPAAATPAATLDTPQLVCEGCGKPITGEHLRVGTKRYHQESCFVCGKCTAVLDPANYYRTKKGALRCPTCAGKV